MTILLISNNFQIFCQNFAKKYVNGCIAKHQPCIKLPKKKHLSQLLHGISMSIILFSTETAQTLLKVSMGMTIPVGESGVYAAKFFVIWSSVYCAGYSILARRISIKFVFFYSRHTKHHIPYWNSNYTTPALHQHFGNLSNALLFIANRTISIDFVCLLT